MTSNAATSIATPESGASPPLVPDAAPRVRPGGRLMLAVLVLLTGVTLLLGYANKDRCVGPDFRFDGRTMPDYDLRIDRDVCYSDIQYLWLGRYIDKHVFPYVHGGITPDGKTLTGGTVEYPVLTGLLMWAGAIWADNDGQYLFWSALLLTPFGLATGWMLGRLARWRALLWAIGPPLVLYAFHNWELSVVCCAVAAVFVMHAWRTRASLRTRGTIAAVLLGLGFAFKLYPGAFVAPLALYVLTASRPEHSLRSEHEQSGSLRSEHHPGRDWWGAGLVCLVAAATAVLVNLPFALAGRAGWTASFEFQSARKVDLTTNSIWFWAFRPDSEPDDTAFQHWVGWLSPTLILGSFAVALVVGWWRWRRDGSYPWIGVSAAMLCGFLLLHKVHSPQYTLWLVPFFVLLAVPWRWIVAYLLCDIAMDVGVFRWFYAVKVAGPAGGDIASGLAPQILVIGVWGRAALLAVLFVVFLTLPDRRAAAGVSHG